jgi:hypothetical protein
MISSLEKNLLVTDIVHGVFLEDCRERNYPFDYNRTMGGGYHYDDVNMARLLKNIQDKLTNTTPALFFHFDEPFIVRVLADTYIKLVADIDIYTNT